MSMMLLREYHCPACKAHGWHRLSTKLCFDCYQVERWQNPHKRYYMTVYEVGVAEGVLKHREWVS